MCKVSTSTFINQAKKFIKISQEKNITRTNKYMFELLCERIQRRLIPIFYPEYNFYASNGPLEDEPNIYKQNYYIKDYRIDCLDDNGNPTIVPFDSPELKHEYELICINLYCKAQEECFKEKTSVEEQLLQLDEICIDSPDSANTEFKSLNQYLYHRDHFLGGYENYCLNNGIRVYLFSQRICSNSFRNSKRMEALLEEFKKDDYNDHKKGILSVKEIKRIKNRFKKDTPYYYLCDDKDDYLLPEESELYLELLRIIPDLRAENNPLKKQEWWLVDIDDRKSLIRKIENFPPVRLKIPLIY